MLLASGYGCAQTAEEFGTVQYALDRPDGTRVSLTMVVVGAVNSSGVSVHEWWDRTTPIAAAFDPPPSLRAGQTIDLEGWMTTLPNGRRAVLCERIAFYLDSRGLVTSALPPMKGILDPSVWPAKGWIPVYSPRTGIQSLSTGGGRTVLTEEIEPPIGGGDPPTPPTVTFTPGTIPYAKSLADNASVTLAGKIVTAATGQLGPFIYIQEPDHSAGIRVNTSGLFTVGEVVQVSGAVTTSTDGERLIQATSIGSLGPVPPLRPSGMTNRDLGGGDFAYDSGAGTGQQGVYNAWLLQEAMGLSNIGLLVKTWGTVTQIDPSGDYFYIYDGSALADGTMTGQDDDNIGVRVTDPSGAPAPSAGNKVEIIGISSCTVQNGHVVRLLRAQSVRNLSVPSTVLHVKPVGKGSQDGSSWDNAMDSIADAITAASSGTEIWVAGGTYTENIAIDKDVRLYGGFAGTESSRSERPAFPREAPDANETILDGNQQGSVVAFSSGATAETVIDGFTITNGVAMYGSGVHCEDASPTISNNRIEGNLADAVGTWGVGIYCENGSPIIRNNRLLGGTYGTVQGGGIYCDSCPSVEIVNNVISGYDISLGDGGGVYSKSSSGLIVSNTVVGNVTHMSWYSGAFDSGGLRSEGSSLTLANNIIAFNSAGVHNETENKPVTMLNNCVYGNERLGVVTNYSGVSPGEGDISSDPVFVNLSQADYHLQATSPASPCIDAGNNAYVRSAVDMDGDYRVQSGVVDIGADEWNAECVWYEVAVFAAPNPAVAGSTVDVYATVYDPSTGARISGVDVTFAVQEGTLTGESQVTANKQGMATTTITRSTTGYATVMATVSVCGGGQAPGKCSVWFYPSTPVSADAWPMFMHDERHTGASTQADTVSESLIESWHASVPTFGGSDSGDHPNRPGGQTGIFTHPYLDSSPVHASGCPVIVGAWAGGEYGDAPTGYVAAFDPVVGDNADADDAPAWRFPRTGFIGAVASTPCIADVEGQKRVYVGSMDGKLYCLNAKTGEYIWSFQTASRGAEDPRILASPVVHDNRVYIGNESARMCCLNAATGSQYWSYDLPVDPAYRDRTGVSSAAIGLVDSQPRVYVGCDNGYLYCLSTADDPVPDPPGRVIWGYDAYGCVESSPTIYDGKVFVGVTWQGGLNLLSHSTINGDSIWQRPLPHEVRGTCAVKDGALYVGIDTGNDFFKRATADGSLMGWFALSLGDYFVGSAALCSANLAVVGNDNGYLYALSRANLSVPLASYDSGGIIRSSPAVTYAAEEDARWTYVLSRSKGGSLCAFRTSLY